MDSSPYVGRHVPTVVVPSSSLTHTQASPAGSNGTEPRSMPPTIGQPTNGQPTIGQPTMGQSDPTNNQTKMPLKPPRTPTPTEPRHISHSSSSSPSKSPTTPSKVEESMDEWLQLGGQGGPAIALHIRRPQGDEGYGDAVRSKNSWVLASQGWGPDDVFVPDVFVPGDVGGDASMRGSFDTACDKVLD